MRKFRMFMDIQKEEKWLNERIQQGWLCKKVHTWGIYDFEKATSSQQVIRLDFQSFKSSEMYQHYIQLHEDYGWQHIGGSRWSSSQYWSKSTDGLDELFSDNASEKSYLQRLSAYYGAFTICFLLFAFNLFKNTSQYISIKSAYFTPGLWDKEGMNFLMAFLFETPFALLRFSSPWLIIIGGIVCMRMYVKYQKALKKIA